MAGNAYLTVGYQEKALRLLHAYSDTPTLTHLLLHAYSYTPAPARLLLPTRKRRFVSTRAPLSSNACS